MIARLAADAVLTLHLAFIAFVVLGGLLASRNPKFAWLHVPAAAWGAYAELTATICPLTPLENALRAQSGAGGYSGSFVEHYLLPIIYPAGLTSSQQRWLGIAVVAINAVIYAVVVRNALRKRRSTLRNQLPRVS